MQTSPRIVPHARGLLTNAALAFAGDIAAKAGMFLALLVAARALPTDEFAQLGVAMAVMLILTAVLDGGVSTVIIRDGANMGGDRLALLRSSALMRLPLLLVMVVGAACSILVFGAAGLTLATVACVVANAAQLSGLAIFRSAQNLAIEAVTKLLCGLSYPIGVVAVIALGHRSATAALVALTVVPVLSVPFLYAVALRYAGPHGAGYPRREIARRALPFAVMAVTVIAYYRSGTVMLGWLGTARDTADYTAASTIGYGFLMLPAAAATSLLPRLAAEIDAWRQIQLTRLALLYSTAAFALLACIVAVSASWAIPLAYGGRFAGAVAPLVILTFAGLVIGAGGIIGTLLIALHQTRVLMLQVLIALAVNLATTAALIPAFGAVGASVATLATEIVSLALLALALERVAPGAVAVWRASTAPVRVKPAVTV